MSKICLVTTIKTKNSLVDTFIDYHLSIGFEHIYLFLDDPTHLQDFQHLRHNKNITLIPYDDKLLYSWVRTPSVQKFFKYINQEFMARQCLNAEVAVGMAKEQQYDWILHMDPDELFYLPEYYKTVSAFFEQYQDKELIQFYNHEALPENLNLKNPFKEVTLFKKNYNTLTPSAKKIVKNTYQKYGHYFLAYSNGRGAANLNFDIRAYSTQSFESSERITGFKRKADNFSQHPFENSSKIHVEYGCSILHFHCCGIQHWENEYVSLGRFADTWYHKVSIKERLPYHILSRDIIYDQSEDSKEFYEKTFLQQYHHEREQWLAAGILWRINFKGLTPVAFT